MFLIPGAIAETATDAVEAVETVVEETAQQATEALGQLTNVSLPESLLYALLGFSIVFIGLIIIIAFIVLTSKITGTKKAAPAVQAAAPAAAAPAVEKPAAPGSCGELKLYNVSDRDAAMIMAIVADEMKTPLNELRFISIKEIA